MMRARDNKQAPSTTIAATVGEPYSVNTTSQGLIILERQIGGRPVRVLFGVDDAYAVANALVDAAEAVRSRNT